jgi:hypothetical protein
MGTTGDIDWLCSVMGGLDFIEQPKKLELVIKYPEIDISFAFQKQQRLPKLTRAVVPTQRRPERSSPRLLDNDDVQFKLSIHLEELERLYAFYSTATTVAETLCADIDGTEATRNFKMICECIRNKWKCEETVEEEHSTVSNQYTWNHEDALSEARQLISDWNCKPNK